MRAKDRLGRSGEDAAADHLAAAGLTIVARNWRCRDGELDIIAIDGATVVFVEVKTRSGTAYGVPAEAVTRVKARRIRHLALQWLQSERSAQGYPEVRFDVVSVLRGRGDVLAVEHLPGVF